MKMRLGLQHSPLRLRSDLRFEYFMTHVDLMAQSSSNALPSRQGKRQTIFFFAFSKSFFRLEWLLLGASF